MTTSSDLFTADCADARAAHQAESAARDIILALPGGPEAIEAAYEAEPKGDGLRSSRGPAAMALRAAAAAVPGAAHARWLLARADALYWGMVLRHDRMIRKESAAVLDGDRGEDQFDDIHQLMRVGWFRAAVRFDPDRGIHFPTMARSWGRKHVAENRDAGQVSAYNRHRNRRKPLPTVDVGDREVSERVGYDPTEAMDAAAERAMRFRLLAPYLSELAPLQASVIGIRYGESGGKVSLMETGRRLGVSKEAARKAELSALERLRSRMVEDGVLYDTDDTGD